MQRRREGQALQVAVGNRISIIGCPLSSNLVNQVTLCCPFGQVATWFSQSILNWSAANLGWLRACQLGSERTGPIISTTRDEKLDLPCNTWKEQSSLPCNTTDEEYRPQSPTAPIPQPEALEALRDKQSLLAARDRVLLELKLGKQATGYKVALKVLNRFICELTNLT